MSNYPHADACEQCGATITAHVTDRDGAILTSWCSRACYDVWSEANPGEWIAVEDLNARQRAELDVLIGNHTGTA